MIPGRRGEVVAAIPKERRVRLRGRGEQGHLERTALMLEAGRIGLERGSWGIKLYPRAWYRARGDMRAPGRRGRRARARMARLAERYGVARLGPNPEGVR